MPRSVFPFLLNVAGQIAQEELRSYLERRHRSGTGRSCPHTQIAQNLLVAARYLRSALDHPDRLRLYRDLASTHVEDALEVASGLKRGEGPDMLRRRLMLLSLDLAPGMAAGLESTIRDLDGLAMELLESPQ